MSEATIRDVEQRVEQLKAAVKDAKATHEHWKAQRATLDEVVEHEARELIEYARGRGHVWVQAAQALARSEDDIIRRLDAQLLACGITADWRSENALTRLRSELWHARRELRELRDE
jgi:hypothetical protein